MGYCEARILYAEDMAELAELAARNAEREKLVDALTADVMGGLRVFVTRDGYALTEDQIRERANNIVCAIVGNYELRAL